MVYQKNCWKTIGCFGFNGKGLYQYVPFVNTDEDRIDEDGRRWQSFTPARCFKALNLTIWWKPKPEHEEYIID